MKNMIGVIIRKKDGSEMKCIPWETKDISRWISNFLFEYKKENQRNIKRINSENAEVILSIKDMRELGDRMVNLDLGCCSGVYEDFLEENEKTLSEMRKVGKNILEAVESIKTDEEFIYKLHHLKKHKKLKNYLNSSEYKGEFVCISMK